MRRILIFIAFLVSIVSLIGCSGGSGSSSAPEGVNTGFPSDIQLSATQYIVQTNSDAFFKARVLDGNGRPLSGVAVTFTNISPVGTISTAKVVSKSGTTVANTNGLGYATARVFSSTPGFVTVQAEVNAGTGKVRDKKTVYFSTFDFIIPPPPTPPPPPPPTLELEVDGEDADVIFDEAEDFNLFETPDDDEVIVRATVRDGNGDPASSVVVTFGADSTEASFPEGSIKTTDLNGQAQVRVKVTPVDLKNLVTNINITASAIVDGESAADMVTLFLQPIVVSNINLTANPTQVAPNGTSAISAFVTTSAGGTVPDGTTVSFTVAPAAGTDPDPCGFVIPFGQTKVGVATSTFTAPSAFGTCTITGTTAGVSGSVNVIVSNALFITPASQTVPVLPPPAPLPGPVTYTITGGTGPYTAFSNNPGLVTVGVAGSTLTATVIAAPTVDTTVTITVFDSVNASATATLILDVPPVVALTVIPASQTIDPNVTPSANYTIMGGTGPYTAFSDNPTAVTVGVVGSILTATVAIVPTTDTTVTITVYDNVGASATATLILDVVSPDPLKVIPTAQTIANPAINDTADYTVLGGIGPYTAFSGSPGLVTVPAGTFAGPTLTATVIAVPLVDTTVTITIYDSVGSSVAASLVLDVAGVTPLAVAPSAVTVTGFANPTDGNTADDVTFTITGGTGPYSMFSSNNAIIASQGLLGGSTFVVDPDAVASSTSVTITVQDSLGAFATATVTVTPPVSSFALLPSAISVLTGDSVTVYLYGGTGPYETFTTDASGLCAPAPGAGSLPDTATSFVVGPIPVGCAGNTFTITLIDNIGRVATFQVTINPIPPAVVSTTPANAATAIAANSSITITWNKAVDCTTVNTTNITINPASSLTLFSCIGSTAIFTTSGQAVSTVYTVTVSTAVTDLFATPMVSPYIFSYTTAP